MVELSDEIAAKKAEIEQLEYARELQRKITDAAQSGWHSMRNPTDLKVEELFAPITEHANAIETHQATQLLRRLADLIHASTAIGQKLILLGNIPPIYYSSSPTNRLKSTKLESATGHSFYITGVYMWMCDLFKTLKLKPSIIETDVITLCIDVSNLI